jgi:glutaredoxin
MKEQFIILYTMKGCPFCVIMKEQLQESNIDFVERDIYEESEEYDLFVKAVDGNEFVPAFMIIETDGENHKSKFFAPERDYDEIVNGVKIIKEHYEKFNIQ